MERSAAYAGIVGALLFVASGIIPGAFPAYSASATTISAYIVAHAFALTLATWLTLPAAAFLLWFAFGLFDYLRGPDDGDRTLSQWGAAGAIVSMTLSIVSVALSYGAAVRPDGGSTALPELYVFDIALFAFAMGAYGAFVFAASHEARRKGTLPSWLNMLGYLTFLVDLAFTLCIFGTSEKLAITGTFAYVAPTISMLWTILASIVLITRTSRSA